MRRPQPQPGPAQPHASAHGCQEASVDVTWPVVVAALVAAGGGRRARWGRRRWSAKRERESACWRPPQSPALKFHRGSAHAPAWPRAAPLAKQAQIPAGAGSRAGRRGPARGALVSPSPPAPALVFRSPPRTPSHGRPAARGPPQRTGKLLLREGVVDRGADCVLSRPARVLSGHVGLRAAAAPAAAAPAPLQQLAAGPRLGGGCGGRGGGNRSAWLNAWSCPPRRMDSGGARPLPPCGTQAQECTGRRPGAPARNRVLLQAGHSLGCTQGGGAVPLRVVRVTRKNLLTCQLQRGQGGENKQKHKHAASTHGWPLLGAVAGGRVSCCRDGRGSGRGDVVRSWKCIVCCRPGRGFISPVLRG